MKQYTVESKALSFGVFYFGFPILTPVCYLDPRIPLGITRMETTISFTGLGFRALGLGSGGLSQWVDKEGDYRVTVLGMGAMNLYIYNPESPSTAFRAHCA